MSKLLIYIVRREHRGWRYEEALRPLFPELEIRTVDNEQEAASEITDADIVFTYGGLLTDEMITAAGRLKWIQTATTGTDFVDRLPSLAPDVLVTSTRGMHGPAMSEMALLHMLAISRGMPVFARNQPRKIWERLPGDLLDGKTVGLLGVGTSAEDLAPKCKALGMKVIGISETEREVPGIDAFHPRSDLVRVAGELDYLVVLAPLTAATRGMVGAEVFAAMKPTSYLINLARGGIVAEDALVAALRDGAIAGAGLDVFEAEPLPPENPLWDMENVVVTPHNGGLSANSVDGILTVFEPNLRSFLAGRPEKMINLIGR